MFITFVIIVMCPIVGISSPWIYIALLPLPLAVKASISAIKYGNDLSKLLPVLGNNVITVLATDLLLAVAVFIDVF
jgi:1,4-dihydroxy-2-naphthoate octaprenyltransferase